MYSRLGGLFVSLKFGQRKSATTKSTAIIGKSVGIEKLMGFLLP
jgi:hypothetical protein